MMKFETKRFETIYDENDWILDTETGDYLSIEDACNVMNDMYEELQANRSFWKTFIRELDKACEEE